MKAPQWMQEALNKRFDDLSYKFQASPDITQLQSRIDLKLKQVVETMEPEIHQEFLKWEEQAISINAMQSEWLYMKGVQDGLELLTFRYLFNESESKV